MKNFWVLLLLQLFQLTFFNCFSSAQGRPVLNRPPLGYSVSVRPCVQEFDKTNGLSGARLASQMQICANRCGNLSADLRNTWGLEPAYQFCAAGAVTNSGAAQRCRDAQARTTNPSGVDAAVWQACQTDCEQAKVEDPSNQATYSSILNACASHITSEPVDTTEDLEGDGDTVADEDGTDTDTGSTDTPTTTANTGSPSPALPAILQGTSLPSPAEFLAGASRGVNFTGGFEGRGGDAVNGTADPIGFSGSSALPPQPPIDDRLQPAGMPANNAGGAGGGGGGMGGGGGGGGLPGGNMAPAGRGGGGGGVPAGRTSIAGAHLQKMNANSFWSGGGSSPAGGGGARMTAAVAVKKAADKKAKTPAYNSKGFGDAGLLRVLGRRLPLEGTSAACGDTVFCPMESHFYKIDLTPNHEELKP